MNLVLYQCIFCAKTGIATLRHNRAILRVSGWGLSRTHEAIGPTGCYTAVINPPLPRTPDLEVNVLQPPLEGHILHMTWVLDSILMQSLVLAGVALLCVLRTAR